jgi:hypothetical protein
MIDASVIICAYTLDRWDDLKAAVQSVRSQVPPAREIIVVIDHNKQLLLDAHQYWIGHYGVTVVANMKTPGLSGGRMTGAELATAPVIVFLDDDAMAEPGWLEGLLDAYRDWREPDTFRAHVLGVGGHIEPLWRSPRPVWFPAEFYWVIGCTYAGMPIKGGRVRNLIGASMSVRTDVLHRAGGFASKLGRREGGGAIIGVVAESCEETEFCIRATRLHPGGVWVHRPESRVQHVVTKQRTTWRYFMRRCRMEGTAKAVLTDLTGTRDGLGSERRYVFGLAHAALRDIATGNIRRAAAICAGLVTTTITYAAVRILMLIKTKTVKNEMNAEKPISRL